MVLVTRRDPRRIIRGDQISLRQIKCDIERSKDKIFFIKHIYAGSPQTRWYLLQVSMEHSEPVSVRNYGMYFCQWYIIQYEDCNKYHSTE